MISRLKNNDGPTSLQAATTAAGTGGVAFTGAGWEARKMLVRILDHDDGRIGHLGDCERDSGQAHDVGIDAEQAHGDEGDQHAHREHDDRHKGAAHVHEEDRAYQRDDNDLLYKYLVQRGDGCADQLGAIVDGLDVDAFGQTGGDFSDFFFNIIDDIERVFPMTRDYNAGDDLSRRRRARLCRDALPAPVRHVLYRATALACPFPP